MSNLLAVPHTNVPLHMLRSTTADRKVDRRLSMSGGQKDKQRAMKAAGECKVCSSGDKLYRVTADVHPTPRAHAWSRSVMLYKQIWSVSAKHSRNNFPSFASRI